jgi:hypothetical protein
MRTSPVLGSPLLPEGYPRIIVQFLAFLSQVSPRFLSVFESRSLLALYLDVKLFPLPQPPLRARTDAWTNPSAQGATHLRSVLARVYAVSRQNQITTTVP